MNVMELAWTIYRNQHQGQKFNFRFALIQAWKICKMGSELVRTDDKIVFRSKRNLKIVGVKSTKPKTFEINIEPREVAMFCHQVFHS